MNGWIYAIRLAALLAFFGAWEFAPRLGIVNSSLLPPFGDVLSTLWGLLDRPKVQEAILVTGAEVLVAFAICDSPRNGFGRGHRRKSVYRCNFSTAIVLRL